MLGFYFLRRFFMRIKTVTAGITLLLAAALLVLAGCPQEAEEYSGDVNLSSLSVDDVAARNLPQAPTTPEEWEREDFKPSEMDIAHVVFPADAFDSDGEIKGAQIHAGVPSGTEIWYIKASGGLKPSDTAWTQENSFDLKPNNSVYLQVTSADKKTQVYYRIQIHILSTEASIKSLIIGGKNTGVSDTDGALILSDVVLGAVNLAFGTENVNARIEVTKTNNGAEVQFLRVETGDAPNLENFSSLAVYDLDDGDTVYVKVIPSDGGAANYYGAVVTSRRISAVNIGGVNTPVPGAGAASLETAAAIDVLITTSEKTQDLTVVKRNAVTIEYAYGAAEFVALTEETQIDYVDGSTLSIKAKGEGFKDLYYKFAVAVKQNVATLDSVTVNTVAPGTLPTPAAAWANAASVTISLGTTAPASIAIAAVVTTGSEATVKYGYTASNTVAPEWAASGTITGTASGGYIGVEVTAEDSLVKQYYKLRLSYGSSIATLAAAPSLYIAGVPIATLGNPGTAYTAASGTTNGTISLNSTQGAIGKSVKVYVTDANVSEVVMSTNNAGTNDTTAPTFTNSVFTKTGATEWTGAITTTALTTNNRRFYIRVTAQDTVTQNFYRFQVTYQANYSVLNTLTIGGTTVAVASRGTPAGSWNASDLVPGNAFIDPVPNPLAVAFAWQTGGTNTTSYGVTSAFPPAIEPTWTTGTSPLSVADVNTGNYIWLRAVNGNYRNIYVLRVGPPPFTLTVAGQAVQFADLFTIAATGNTTVSGNPTPMTKVFLTEQQMANTVVSVTKTVSTDTVKVIKYPIPESAGTTVTTNAQTTSFGTAPENGGTFDLNPAGSVRGLPVLQVQYNGSSYYNIVARKTQDVPFTATAPVIDGELDTVWTTAVAPEITIDRIATDTTAAGLTAADRGKPAKIKVLWDDTALYYYAKVYDTDVTTAGADHNTDNIEFFKQETWTPAATGNTWTGQYRINAAGTLTGSSTAANTTAATKKFTEGSDEGYIIEARITWSASDVASWSTGGTDKEIGVEFQVAYAIASTRNAAMSWNNRFGANYQQSANAGRFVLKR
jgi:hypothetical protein